MIILSILLPDPVVLGIKIAFIAGAILYAAGKVIWHEVKLNRTFSLLEDPLFRKCKKCGQYHEYEPCKFANSGLWKIHGSVIREDCVCHTFLNLK